MADLNGSKIYEKLETIENKVDQLLIWRAEHNKQHEMLERDIACNRAALFENPGVLDKLNSLWENRSSAKIWHNFWMEILKYLIVAGVVSFVTWMLVLYKGQ